MAEGWLTCAGGPAQPLPMWIERGKQLLELLPRVQPTICNMYLSVLGGNNRSRQSPIFLSGGGLVHIYSWLVIVYGREPQGLFSLSGGCLS